MSIALRPDRRQALWRKELLQEIGTKKTYHNVIVRDLRPIWKRVQARYWPSRFMPNIYEVFRVLEDLEYEIGPVDPDLTSYCVLLRSIVSDDFRLRWNNEPAWWALEAFHDHVTSGNRPDRPTGIPYVDFIFWREFELKVRVTEDGASITVVDHFGEQITQEYPNSGLLSFQDWSSLEKEAIAALKHQIADIRH